MGWHSENWAGYGGIDARESMRVRNENDAELSCAAFECPQCENWHVGDLDVLLRLAVIGPDGDTATFPDEGRAAWWAGRVSQETGRLVAPWLCPEHDAWHLSTIGDSDDLAPTKGQVVV